MTQIFLPVAIVAGVGLFSGLMLSAASALMSGQKDERFDEILAALPGVNCGACGFSGCKGYARALADGETSPGLCAPGGDVMNAKIADILGENVKKTHKGVAIVRCNGTCHATGKKADYIGIQSCAAAAQIYAGGGACQYGCIGYGDCQAAYEFGAISICDGVARIDPNRCTGCGKCQNACPMGLITVTKANNQAVVRCFNDDKGAITKKICTVGCMGCRLCEKACNFDAICIKNNLASVDSTKCTACGACQDVCPNGCIELLSCDN